MPFDLNSMSCCLFDAFEVPSTVAGILTAEPHVRAAPYFLQAEGGSLLPLYPQTSRTDIIRQWILKHSRDMQSMKQLEKAVVSCFLSLSLFPSLSLLLFASLILRTCLIANVIESLLSVRYATSRLAKINISLISKNQANPKLANLNDDDGRLPLHWAVSYNHLPVVEILVQAKGFDPDAQVLYTYCSYYMKAFSG